MKKYVIEAIKERYICLKCQNSQAIITEVTLTNTKLGKLFDLEDNDYFFVCCTSCGYVEIYNPTILVGKKEKELSTVLDTIFN
ncbi:MAG: zinc ribbon domain-containing protein [Bacillaceae bacterium]